MQREPQNWQPKYLHYVTIALVACFMTSNILAFKIVELFGNKFGVSALFFPFALIVGDLLGEVYGYRRTRLAVVIALIAYCYFVIASQITTILPPAPQWTYQAEYERFFGVAPRIFLAGCMAYIAGELLNAYVLTRLKVRQKGKHFWLRAMAGSIIGELAHSGIAIPIVFYSILPPLELMKLVFVSAIIKLIVQTLVLPFTSFCARRLKQAEGVDHFDKV